MTKYYRDYIIRVSWDGIGWCYLVSDPDGTPVQYCDHFASKHVARDEARQWIDAVEDADE